MAQTEKLEYIKNDHKIDARLNITASIRLVIAQFAVNGINLVKGTFYFQWKKGDAINPRQLMLLFVLDLHVNDCSKQFKPLFRKVNIRLFRDILV